MDKLEKVNNEVAELQNNSPHSLISQALAQGLGIDVLERLMDLQERWEANQSRKLFFEALSKFQSELPEIKKTKKVSYASSKGGNVNYNYSPLPYIIKAIKKPLKNNGFSYRWEFTETNGKIKCDCIINHIGGHSEICSMEADKDTSGNKNDIQSIGSARTYLQRYTLNGGFGLATMDEDNDGITSQSQKQAEKIPEPKQKEVIPFDWTDTIKSCKNTKELKALWERLSEPEQTTFKKTFEDVKGFIEDAKKKEK